MNSNVTTKELQVFHGAGQDCACDLLLVQWHPEEHSCLTCNNRSSVTGKEGIILLLHV